MLNLSIELMANKASSFISGAGIYLLSNVVNSIIPFILLPILTRYLSPEEYGEVAVFYTLLGALGAFVGATFVGAVGRKFYDANLKENELSEFIGSCIQLIVLCTLFVFLIFYLFQEILSDFLLIKKDYVLLSVIVSFCSVIIALRLGQWQVEKKAARYGVLQFLQGFLNMLLSLIFVVYFLYGVDGRISAQIISGLFFSVVALFSLKKDGLINIFIWRRKNLFELLSFGIPLIPHVVGGFLLTSVDRLIINRELGLTEVGIYMLGVQLVSAAGIVFDAINKAYVPWLFEKLKINDYKEKEKIVRLTYFWFVMVLFGVALSFFVGPWLVVIVAGEKYIKTGEVVGLLALGQGFKGMYLMVTNYIFYSKETGLLSVVSMVSGTLNLLLLFLFVPFWGVEGAAAAFAVSMGFRFLFTWFVAQKKHPMPWLYFFKSENDA